MPPPREEVPADEQVFLIRQNERTIDNLKRLFAFVFALSFGAIGIGAIEKLRPLLVGANVHHSIGTWFANIEILTIFAITASMFFHNGAKFLDNRYARPPFFEVHPFGFAWDYLTVAATMVPFFFMAHSFHPSVTSEVGFIWFFWSYVSLLLWGLILLVISDVRHSPLVTTHILQESIPKDELDAQATLRTYWLFMNSLILLLVLAGFWFETRAGGYCPTSAKPEIAPFILWFGALALLRDALDYSFSWHFVFPVSKAAFKRFETGLLMRAWKATNPSCMHKIAYLFIAGSVILLVFVHPFDSAYWVRTCKAC